MATTLLPGVLHWSLEREDDGHRTYTVKHRVKSDDGTDEPGQVLLTSGLPVVGSPWVFGGGADFWAFCQMYARVIPVIEEGEKTKLWTVEQKFTTKPNKFYCREEQFEDPLLEPQKISGTFIKYTEEATQDRFGNPVVNSAFEQLRGPQVEFDKNRPQVRIEQNVANLQLAFCAAMVDTVNDRTLWGCPARCIKLSNFDWEKKYYGHCYSYYTRTFVFDIRYPETFDRYLLDEGTKALRGHWDKRSTSPTYKQYVLENGVYDNGGWLNPSNFIRFKDWNGENTRTLLNGYGRPYDPGVTSEDSTGSGTGTGDDRVIGTIYIQKYDESNFLELNIPTTL